MKTSHGVVQGYTGVAAVDAKSQVVIYSVLAEANRFSRTGFYLPNQLRDYPNGNSARSIVWHAVLGKHGSAQHV
jgi:hypothetical protein